MTVLRRLSEEDHIQARQSLIDALQWTPLDFLRNESFRQAEVLEIADAWTRLRPLDDDFSFGDETGTRIIFAERLRWDSDFFGYPVVRLNGIWHEDKDCEGLVGLLKAWLSELHQQGVKYVFTVTPPEDLICLDALSQCGFTLLETRLTYHRSLAHFVPEAHYHVRRATWADVDVLGETARTCVNPFDRFHADPFISQADADRMMTEWVRASIEDGFADFVLVPDTDNPQAFCTVKSHQQAWAHWGMNLAQPVVLGAVHTQFKGWYQKLISESQVILKSMGAEHAFWKTQLTNRAAIRTAEKLGYQLGRSEFVFRIVL